MFDWNDRFVSNGQKNSKVGRVDYFCEILKKTGMTVDWLVEISNFIF